MMLNWLSRLQAFLVATAFWPYIAGAALTPRWAIAGLSVYFMTPLALLFCLYCFAVLPVDAAVRWSIIAGAFSFGTKLKNIDGLILAFAAGVAISGVIALFQIFGWAFIPQAVSPAGLFVNKNYMGEAAVLALVARDLCVRRSLFDVQFSFPIVVGCLLALVLSTSRASWLALFAAALVTIRWTPRRTLLVLALAGVLILGMAELGGTASVFQRLALWNAGVREFRWFGAGAPLEPLHNDFLQTIFELGLGAAVPFGVAGYLVVMRSSQAQSFLVATAIIATFGFPLHLPATVWFIAVVAGHLVGNQPVSSRTCVVAPRPAGGDQLVPVGRVSCDPEIERIWSLRNRVRRGSTPTGD